MVVPRHERDADARADRRTVVAFGQGDGARPRADPLGRGPGLLGAGPLEQDDELVPPDPSDEVTGADRVEEEAREAAQELVAGRVPDPVVDLLEVVEVDQEEGRGEAALGPGDEPGEVLVDDAAVRKVGEGVVPREVDDRLLVALPLGDVPLDRDEVGDFARRRPSRG